MKYEVSNQQINNKMKMLKENKRRLDKYFYEYNPYAGDSRQMCIPRQKVRVFDNDFYLPVEFINKEALIIDNINKLENSPKTQNEFLKLRLKYDFEFWTATCAHIKHKQTASIIKLVANYGQRKIIREMEKMRLARLPIRIILDKCRQYGGSTVIQLYILWIQLFHRKGWDSIIVTDVERQARIVRGMTTRVLKSYPESVEQYSFTPYEGAQTIRQIPERDCKIAIGSAQDLWPRRGSNSRLPRAPRNRIGPDTAFPHHRQTLLS